MADVWQGKDFVKELFDEILIDNSLVPFTQQELYEICEEGEKRYKQEIPPGFKNGAKKDGIKKYSDLIIWKEILKYASEHEKNIIFVTDDVKRDWWQDGSFHPLLIEEFEAKTQKTIQAYRSTDFYSKISGILNIEKSDAIEIALKFTDLDYFNRIQDDVFGYIEHEIIWSGDRLINLETVNIGSEGIEEFEIIEYEFINAKQVERDFSEITYSFEYDIEIEGTSRDYWGRDDDTKEIILSPGVYHKFKGSIFVDVSRELDTFLDYFSDNDFNEAKIVSGVLEEIERRDYLEEDYYNDMGYTTCPKCGKPISFDNDALNGYCINCEPN
ncbi:PIN-like domain-containing protein [Clostridium algidicarnis]|uniref:PIN-like domain-containing protein n=1 Tax=Clostridium algidicarnis TaxID=37659 RepID=UPI003C2B4438